MKRILLCLIALCLLAGCAPAVSPAPSPSPAPAETLQPTPAAPAETPAAEADPMAVVGQMALSYATQFTVDYLACGGALISVGAEDRFLLLPEGVEVPQGADADLVILRQPMNTLYNAASSAMDFFVQLDAMSQVRFTSTTYKNWGLPEVRDALDAGTLVYAGKYSAPDFELLLGEKCSLAIESTMIYHSPDIKEKLENLGIPVLVERSSYEPHPLGRVEWIKLYGLLLGKEAEAEAFYADQLEQIAQLADLPAGELTVAYFHISTARSVVVRKPGDYLCRMIQLAGGKYIFDELPGQDDSSLSTMNMDMEAFYAGAKDADILIYNSTIDGELNTLDQLLAKSELLGDFKAVKSGNVWCSEHDLFQKSSAAAMMIRELNRILSGEAAEEDQLEFFHRLK
ncbi:MAG: ABC transporter substrate-binding protein [Oscillospiraceae bacterium]|nr:ABC transporter substrate-binding protein [Oscillospiraceae bacterium]